MASTSEGRALFHKGTWRTDATLKLDASTQTKDFYVSSVSPSHALWTDRANQGLRAKTSEPVLREWLLNQSLNLTADQWSLEALKGVHKRLSSPELGVFTPAFPRFQDQSGNGDGISVTRYFADSPIGQPFPNRNWHEAFQLFAASIQDVLSANKAEILLGSGDDILAPGWLGNSTAQAGPGNDTILSSPQLYIAEMYDTFLDPVTFGADWRYWNAYIYYPTPYIAKGSKLNPKGNNFHGNEGDDLIYYDSGVASANGDEGDDILAPSFGSFNWGLDTLIQGSGLTVDPDTNGWGSDSPQLQLHQEKLDIPTSYSPHTRTFVRGKRALLSPQRNVQEAQKVPTTKTFGYDYGVNGYSFYAQNRAQTDTDFKIELHASDKQQGLNFGLSKDPVTSKIVIDIDEINTIGGSILRGGPGSDLFYGIDPQLYAGYSTAADGLGLRLAFLKQQDNEGDKPPRYIAQQLIGTRMLGGTGPDYFALGNPGNLDPWEIKSGYDYLYRISGNSDEFKPKEDTSFGNNASPDIYEANLTYAGENWKNTIVIEPGTGGKPPQAPDAAELAGLGFTGLSTVKDLIGGFGGKVPIFGAFVALGNFALKLSTLFKPTPKAPITQSNRYYADPIGSWRQKINIQDWDPSDAIVIRVDPSDPAANRDNRWNQINLSLDYATDLSNSRALDLKATVAGKPTQTLFRLEDIEDSASSGAWYGWDFTRSQPGYQQIGKDNLGFFGQVEMESSSDASQDQDLVAYKDQYGFSVDQGSPLFRWNDTTLRNDPERLNSMKQRSERIITQLDTMTLGYYWDVRYQGQASSPTESNPKINNLAIDKQASKLWIREDGADGNPDWRSYSFTSIETDLTLQALARKATPLWSRQAPTSTELLDKLEALDTEMTGTLNDLVPAPAGAQAPRTGSEGKLLQSNPFALTDLNTVKDIIIEGGANNSYAVVYHKPPAGRSKAVKILKTIIDNNIVFPAHGLSRQEILKDELLFNQDLDGNGLIGRMSTSAAG